MQYIEAKEHASCVAEKIADSQHLQVATCLF